MQPETNGHFTFTFIYMQVMRPSIRDPSSTIAHIRLLLPASYHALLRGLQPTRTALASLENRVSSKRSGATSTGQTLSESSL